MVTVCIVLSLVLFGSNCFKDELRVMTSIELFLYAEFYASHSAFDTFPNVETVLKCSVSNFLLMMHSRTVISYWSVN